MHEDHEQLDQELERLGRTLRSGEHMLACLQLAELALKLDHFLRREERALAFACLLIGVNRPHALASLRREHTSLRQLVSAIASALDRADDRSCLASVSKLRSVLLLHVEKEKRLHAPPQSFEVH
ncbi:MAG TPA: hemerythrin domain-containing protein [Kofleriaceae bacterium]|jgi:hypothetical protein|nr:hemerythrin domain-containing protein [Kofleriaceae bacterium]